MSSDEASCTVSSSGNIGDNASRFEEDVRSVLGVANETGGMIICVVFPTSAPAII